MSVEFLRRKPAKKTHQFTMMLVGQSGLGKSTFINTLFNNHVFLSNELDPSTTDYENFDDLYKVKPIQFKEHNYGIVSKFLTTIKCLEHEAFGNKFSIRIVDTPGFGDSLSNEAGCESILRYLESQFDRVLDEESRIKRNPKFEDSRVHALLYFIPPTGHSLKELDILFLKSVAKRVNIIPVIAKSDAFNLEELKAFKTRIIKDIEYYQIPIYNFPTEITDVEDEEILLENEALKKLLPFAIIGAEDSTICPIEDEGEYNSSMVQRGRQYQWGFVNVDDPDHCDFVKLKAVLLNSHFQDLKDITQNVLYENYRTEKLSQPTQTQQMPLNEMNEKNLNLSKDSTDILEYKKKDLVSPDGIMNSGNKPLVATQ